MPLIGGHFPLLEIWNLEIGDIVLDNQPGDPDGAAARQVIRSGQMRVHGTIGRQAIEGSGSSRGAPTGG